MNEQLSHLLAVRLLRPFAVIVDIIQRYPLFFYQKRPMRTHESYEKPKSNEL